MITCCGKNKITMGARTTTMALQISTKKHKEEQSSSSMIYIVRGVRVGFHLHTNAVPRPNHATALPNKHKSYGSHTSLCLCTRIRHARVLVYPNAVSLSWLSIGHPSPTDGSDHSLKMATTAHILFSQASFHSTITL